MSNAMSLKAKIRNIAKQKNIPAQVILQNYMFERLLVRLSASEYKEKFVLKGGMLVAAIVGLDIAKAAVELAKAEVEKFDLEEAEEILADAKMSANQLGDMTDVEEILDMLKRQETANLLKYCVIVAATLPMMLIYPWLQKYFEKGVMIGSVKG